MNKKETFQEIVDIQERLADVSFQHWVDYSLFTPYWWALLLSFIAIWCLFIRMKISGNVYSTVLILLLSHVIFSVIDGELISSAKITYIIRLQPIRFPHIIIDFAFIPVTAALLYQFFSRWRDYIILSFIASCALIVLYHYVFEPVHIVRLKGNSHWLLGTGAFFTLLLSRYLTNKILDIHNTNNKGEMNGIS